MLLSLKKSTTCCCLAVSKGMASEGCNSAIPLPVANQNRLAPGMDIISPARISLLSGRPGRVPYFEEADTGFTKPTYSYNFFRLFLSYTTSPLLYTASIYLSVQKGRDT